MSIIGQKFSKLLVLSEAAPRVYLRTSAKRVNCLCDCGNTTTVNVGNLKSLKTKSCGCHKKATAKTGPFKHGLIKTPEYGVWSGIKKRCFSKNYREFHLYGGRGISMCPTWRYDFLKFLSDMGPRPDNMSLDRIDNNGNYSKSNCRWATPKEQTNNRRKTIYVETESGPMLLSEFAIKCGVSYFSAYHFFARRKLNGSALFEALISIASKEPHFNKHERIGSNT